MAEAASESLRRLACDGDLETFQRELLQASQLNAQAPDWGGFALLHYAAMNERAGHEILRLLVEQGHSPLTLDKDGWTPLHVACFNGTLECVRYLVSTLPKGQRGTLTNIVSAGGDTAVKIAVRARFEPIVDFLIDEGEIIEAEPSEDEAPSSDHEASDGEELDEEDWMDEG